MSSPDRKQKLYKLYYIILCLSIRLVTIHARIPPRPPDRAPAARLRINGITGKLKNAIFTIMAPVIFAAIPPRKQQGRQQPLWRIRNINRSTDKPVRVYDIKLKTP